jgi:hypothetical protein
MAEMNTQGEYVVNVKDKESGEYIEKAISELGQEDLVSLQKETLTEGEKMYDIASQSLSQLERIGNLQETVSNSMSTMLATGEYGNTTLQKLVEGNDKLYGVTADNRMGGVLEVLSLTNEKLNQSQIDLAKTTGDMLDAASEGDLATAGVKYLESMEQMFTNIIKPGLEKTGVGEDLKSGDYATVAGQIAAKEVAKGIATFVSDLMGYIKDPSKIFEIKPAKDIAITADGIHYSLDKGDMLMALNQQKLASAIGASSPSPILPTAVENNYASNEVKKESTPKELNVNINFTHESKGADINVAQEFSKSLRDNTSLQQQLVQQISENIKNYGLTA